MVLAKHNKKCAEAKTPRKNCKCRCKGLLHGSDAEFISIDKFIKEKNI